MRCRVTSSHGGGFRYVFIGLTALLVGCGAETPTPQAPTAEESAAEPPTAAAPAPEDLPDPDLSSMDPSVARQLADARRAVVESWSNGLAGEDLGNRLGDLAMLYHAYDLLAAADPAYALAQELDGGEQKWAYYRGLIAQRQGRHGEALAFFEASPPGTTTAWQKGSSLRGLGRDDEAKTWLEKAAEDPQRCPAALFELGRLALDEDRLEDAVARFERVLQIQGNAEQVFFPLGQALRRLGRIEEAEVYLRRSAERETSVGGRARCVDPWNAELGKLTTGAAAFITRGQHARFAGDLDTAVVLFEKAVEIAPEDPVAHQALGKGLAEKGDIEGAIDHFRRASELDPSSPWLAHDYATLLSRAGRLAEAVSVLVSTLDAHPDFAPAWTTLARVRRAEGDLPAALESVDRALGAEPADAGARGLRAQLLVEAGRVEEAVEVMGSLLDELPPEDPRERLVLATALSRLGAGERARRHLVAVAEDPEAGAETRARAYLSLAGLDLQRGDREGARRFLEAAVALDPNLAPAREALERLSSP